MSKKIKKTQILAESAIMVALSIAIFEEYAKMGIKMIPPFLIPLLKSEIKSYLNE